jgi:hypothetical protein
VRDVLTREAIGLLERVTLYERDKLIVRIFGDVRASDRLISRERRSDDTSSRRNRARRLPMFNCVALDIAHECRSATGNS